MPANKRRGEVSGMIGGRERRLCLTLGALAELEDAFALDDIAGLAERFGSGRLSARDLTRIIGAGLRGAGGSETDEDVAALPIEGGAAGAAAMAVALLEAAFGGGSEAAARP